MTRIYPEEETCLICNTTHKFTFLQSTNASKPDLDTRPNGMARYTIDHWIRHCPTCNYCSPRISNGSRMVKDVVFSDLYQQQINNDQYPALANHFLCWGIIQTEMKSFPEAGWAATHAAWVCDDQAIEAAAYECRKKALATFRMAKEFDQYFAEELGLEEVVMADLYRRIGSFDQAINISREGLTKSISNLVEKVLSFQIALSNQKDTSCYSIDMIESIKNEQENISEKIPSEAESLKRRFGIVLSGALVDTLSHIDLIREYDLNDPILKIQEELKQLVKAGLSNLKQTRIYQDTMAHGQCTEAVGLQKAELWGLIALVFLGEHDAIPRLLACLKKDETGSSGSYSSAFMALKYLTGEDLGNYSPSDLSSLKENIELWEKWWQKNK